MIVINCDNLVEIEQAKQALDNQKYGLIIMEEVEEWSLIRTALEYASDFMDEDDAKEKLYQVWQKLL